MHSTVGVGVHENYTGMKEGERGPRPGQSCPEAPVPKPSLPPWRWVRVRRDACRRATPSPPAPPLGELVPQARAEGGGVARGFAPAL